MEKKEFQAESKRLLELMINSIYSQKEVFLRELISNSSDAIDKIYYKTLTDKTLNFNQEDYYIQINADKESRILKVADTGIGMTKEELEDNLGTIAKSGSHAFKAETEMEEDYDIIGQFGVGFYAAFMVADEITVRTKALNSETAYEWQSDGAEGYTIKEIDKSVVGTEVILTIKEDTEENNYTEYLDEYRLKEIIKKYSDFIRYPIKMEVTKSEPQNDESEELVEYKEEEIVNSMVPIWRKSRSELTDEDYINFYHEKNYGFDKPLKYIHTSVDGTISYSAILYIPEALPFDFYSKEYEKGLELYANGVLIMEKSPELIPDYFSFVKGMVDSDDLSLNISREMLQQDRQVQLISKNITRKIKTELESMLKNDRDNYIKFYETFGSQLKYGVYSDYGMNKDTLKNLIMFYSSKEKNLVTLNEYVERMPEDQKYIYYAIGESNARIDAMPQAEIVSDLGYEILYFTEDVDEFAIKMLEKYNDKEFRSVSSSDLGIDLEDDEAADKEATENKDLFKKMDELLTGKVKEVKASTRLRTHPVCFSSDGEISIEMEKVLQQMPENPDVKAEKVLEINVNHDVYKQLKDSFEKEDETALKLYTDLLYNQALLIEGLPIEDPVAFTNNIWKLTN